MADAIWNDRYILANGAVSANAPISGDGSNSQPLGLDLKTDNSLSGNGTLTSPLSVVPGYNETVLFSGEVNSTTTTANLSEPISSFNKVKMLCKLNRSTPDAAQWFEFASNIEYCTMIGGVTNNTTTAGKAYMGEAMVSLTGGKIDYYNGKQLEWGSSAVSNSKNASIYQVVGVNRIASTSNVVDNPGNNIGFDIEP